jgi:hypothetical protein
MNRVVKSTLLTLVLLAPASVLAQSDVGVYVTGPDLQTKELEFKVVEGQKVKSGFQVKPESVVQVTQGGSLLVVTEPRNNVDNVKITDGGGKITELVNTNGDTFSLSGIAPGIYTLDVIANLPSSDDRAAYETILVILSPGQAPVQPIEVINKVKIITEVTFEEVEDDNECSNEPGSAGLPFPQDKRTECELEEWNDCKDKREELRKVGKHWDSRCDNLNERFIDNDCFGFNSQKECNDYFNDQYKFCQENPNHRECDPEPCDENTRPGELCRDEGDFDSCDRGYVDSGRGCEPIDCEANPDHADCSSIKPNPEIFPDDSVEFPGEDETISPDEPEQEDTEEIEEDDSEEEEER